MKLKIFYCLLFCITFACCNQEKSTGNSTHSQHKHQPTKENPPTVKQGSDTERMVEELRQLVVNGSARDYYHWNGKKADYYKSQLTQTPPEKRGVLIFNYCVKF